MSSDSIGQWERGDTLPVRENYLALRRALRRALAKLAFDWRTRCLPMPTPVGQGGKSRAATRVKARIERWGLPAKLAAPPMPVVVPSPRRSAQDVTRAAAEHAAALAVVSEVDLAIVGVEESIKRHKQVLDALTVRAREAKAKLSAAYDRLVAAVAAGKP